MNNMNISFFWEDIDPKRPWQPLETIASWLFKRTHSIEPIFADTVFIQDKKHVSIGAGTKIFPNSFIEGHCVIGKNCTIGPNAFIRKNSIIGNETVIGNCCEVKGSIIGNNSAISHFCYIGDSIIGNSVNLGAGVKCANVRLDKKTVKVKIDKIVVDSGRLKLGALIGDNVSIGCNSVCNPGTVVLPNTKIFPLQSISGYCR